MTSKTYPRYLSHFFSMHACLDVVIISQILRCVGSYLIICYSHHLFNALLIDDEGSTKRASA